jgi:UDP-3-O-[3-hydroxymyristoyl] glucosamine N-acyltransferase
LRAALERLSGATVICHDEPGLEAGSNTLIFADNPRLAFIRAVAAFFVPQEPPGIHASAVISSGAVIDPSATIGPYVVVDDKCEVGAGSVIHSHVHLYPGVRVGCNVVVHSGTVIGADGFGYERNETGDLEKFPHLGGVIIEDNVEIGSNTSIDRGTLGDTRILTGARIDNQCHIAHNVTIGRCTAVIAQSMIGGSVQIGDYAWVAPSATILNQITIGEGATVGLGAVVVKTVPPRTTVMGVPAIPADEFRGLQRRLKEL